MIGLWNEGILFFFIYFLFLYIFRGGLVYNDKKNTVVLEFVAPIVWIPFVAVKSALSGEQHAPPWVPRSASQFVRNKEVQLKSVRR